MTDKFCPFCERRLPVASFAVDDKYVDGHNPRCYECVAGLSPPKVIMSSEEDHIPCDDPPRNPFLEIKRKRNLLKDALTKNNYWPEKTPEPDDRKRARRKVRDAVKAGKIQQSECELKLDGCVNYPTQAHHTSYDQGNELDIIWLCQKCHSKITLAQLRAKRKSKHAERSRRLLEAFGSKTNI